MHTRTVFIIDDSEIILEVARDALECENYRVETMSNWAELDKMLENSQPDLILMDVKMPEAYGDTALMFFREKRDMLDTPILLFSDIPAEELELRAIQCAADGYISKSWGVDRLVEEVDKRLANTDLD